MIDSVRNAAQRYNVFMPVRTFSLSLTTRGDTDVQDITDAVAHQVAQSGVKNGTVTIFCPSSTSALTTIEYESGAVTDLRRLFDEIIPREREYAHNARWLAGRQRTQSHPRCLAGPIADDSVRKWRSDPGYMAASHLYRTRSQIALF